MPAPRGTGSIAIDKGMGTGGGTARASVAFAGDGCSKVAVGRPVVTLADARALDKGDGGGCDDLHDRNATVRGGRKALLS